MVNGSTPVGSFKSFRAVGVGGKFLSFSFIQDQYMMTSFPVRLSYLSPMVSVRPACDIATIMSYPRPCAARFDCCKLIMIFFFKFFLFVYCIDAGLFLLAC